jgi:hypothetical protein
VSLRSAVMVLRRVDLSLIVLGIVLVMLGAAIWEMARAFPDAGKGLIIYARQQKDLFIDAGLAQGSYRVRSTPRLTQDLRSQTVIVATKSSPETSFVGAGVIVAMHQGLVEILTAKHIVAHRGRTLVIFPDRTERFAVAVRPARDRDLALVYVAYRTHDPLSHVRLAQDTFATGQPFVVMGHPGITSWTASPGLAEHHLSYTLLFCPTCDKGDSGAGAFDTAGRLRGIVVSRTIMRVTSVRTGRIVSLAAFQIEQPEAIRAFLRTAR